MLVDATKRLLREMPYAGISVAAILERSGLSTGAFYRHFQSKDELMVSVYRDNGSVLGALLAERVAAATTPPEALEAWMEEMLRLAFEPRTVQHVALFADAGLRAAVAEAGVVASTRQLMLAPLVTALDAGRRDGSLPAAEPRVHAPLILAMVIDVIEHRGIEGAGRRSGKRATLERLLAFTLRGLGGR